MVSAVHLLPQERTGCLHFAGHPLVGPEWLFLVPGAKLNK